MEPNTAVSRIPLSQHDLHERDLQGLAHELRNGDMIGGPRIVELAEHLATRTGQLESVTTATYTDAARLLLLAMDIHEGDEIILPAFASGVVTQAVFSVGATPVYADCHPRTLNIAPGEVESCITARYPGGDRHQRLRQPGWSSANWLPSAACWRSRSWKMSPEGWAAPSTDGWPVHSAGHPSSTWDHDRSPAAGKAAAHQHL